MSRDETPWWKNAEWYSDPTAAEALANIKRSQNGALSRINGDRFEKIIEDSIAWYEEKGIVCAEKTPEPMKPLAKPDRKGRFLACFIKKAQPDFQGTLVGGRSVVFEAKHTEADRIDYSRLTDEQVKKLKKHHALGAAAFVLVSFGLRDFYRIPWEVWRDMKAIYGYKHMKQTECEPYRVQYIAGVLKLFEDIELDYNAKKGETT